MIFVPLTIFIRYNAPGNVFTEFSPNSLEENEKIVFADWWNIQAGYHIVDGEVRDSKVPTGIDIKYFRPTLSQPLIVADQIWESNLVNVYCSLIYDQGLYRLWYEGYPDLGSQEDSNANLCYAQSVDGLTWEKPILNLAEFEGSTANNIIFTPEMHPNGDGLHGSTIFLDPHAPATEKYKMTFVAKDDVGDWVVFGATSANGLEWNLIPGRLVKEHADSQTVICWDESKQKYVGYFRHWEMDRRHITYAETEDFRTWPQPRLILGAEATLPPSTDYYTNSYTPWPDAPGAHLMFPTLYHRGSVPLPGDHNDVSFAVSRNGLNWNFPFEEPYLGVGEPGSGYEGKIFMGVGIVDLPNGSWAMPVGCSPYTHNQKYPASGYSNDIRLATIRHDGFSAVVAEDAGDFWTIPYEFEGSSLQINAETGGSGWIKVELVNSVTHQPLLLYTIDDCNPLTGDLLWQTVEWGSLTNFALHSGQKLEIHIQMMDAQIYGLKFV